MKYGKLILNGNDDEYIYYPDNKFHKLISSGKFSNLFKGERKSDNAFVIIKMLNENLSKVSKAVNRFKQESSFNFFNPNIIKVFDYIEQDGNCYIVMEYVDGINLKQISQHRKYRKNAKQRFYIKCIIEVLDALEELHNNRIYHRDIKPSNIIVEFVNTQKDIDFESPKVKLIDLGQFKSDNSELINVEPFSLIYSPPEQVLNIQSLINTTSDIYSTGITLYELLTGEPPFWDCNPLKLMTLQIAANIPEDKHIKPELFEILKKATDKYIFPRPPHYYKLSYLIKLLKEGQDNRFQSAKEFNKALIDFVNLDINVNQELKYDKK